MKIRTLLAPAMLMTLWLASACTSAPARPGAAAPVKAEPTACIREGQACSREAAQCCTGMMCVGGDAGACMPGN